MIGRLGRAALAAACLLAALAGEFPAETASRAASRPASAPAAGGCPRIAMLWSPAEAGRGHWARIARHDVIVLGIERIALKWTPNKFPALVETIDPATVAKARENLRRLKRLNPSAVVLCEVYFFEEKVAGYPPDHRWWLRNKRGEKQQFWPGTHRMDITRDDYIAHVAGRIAAVHQATGGAAGIFLDNLRFDRPSKVGWLKLLRRVRLARGWRMPILVNAGWSSDDLAWIAPHVNGIMYEDAVAHTKDGDTEAFYGRVAAIDRLLVRPRISVNERFGRRGDAGRMRRELLRTLVYTDMSFLYSDSTVGHRHGWFAEWDAPLGRAVAPRPGPPRASSPGGSSPAGRCFGCRPRPRLRQASPCRAPCATLSPAGWSARSRSPRATGPSLSTPPRRPPPAAEAGKSPTPHLDPKKDRPSRRERSGSGAPGRSRMPGRTGRPGRTLRKSSLGFWRVPVM